MLMNKHIVISMEITLSHNVFFYIHRMAYYASSRTVIRTCTPHPCTSQTNMSTNTLYRMCGGWRESLHKAGSSHFVAHAQDDSCPLKQHDARPSKCTHRPAFHSQSAEQADMPSDKTSTIKQQNREKAEFTNTLSRLCGIKSYY